MSGSEYTELWDARPPRNGREWKMKRAGLPPPEVPVAKCRKCGGKDFTLQHLPKDMMRCPCGIEIGVREGPCVCGRQDWQYFRKRKMYRKCKPCRRKQLKRYREKHGVALKRKKGEYRYDLPEPGERQTNILVSEMHNNLAEVWKRVDEGEVFLICRGDEAVAWLLPLDKYHG